MDIWSKLIPKFSALAAVGALFLALLGGAGWVLDVEILKSLIPNMPTMKPNTASMLAILAAALLLSHREGAGYRLAAAGACYVLVISFVYLFGANALESAPIPWLRLAPSPATSLTLFLLALSLALLQTARIGPLMIAAITVFASLLPLHRLVTFIVGHGTLDTTGPFDSMSPPTALALFLLGSGLCLHPRLPYAGQLIAPTLQGRLLRSALPWTLVAPIFVATLFTVGIGLQFYNLAFVIVAVAATSCVVMTIATWILSEKLQRSDNLRREAQRALDDQAQHTQAILNNVLDGIITIDQQGRIDSFNRAAENIFGYGASDAIGKNIQILMPEPNRSSHDGYLHNYMTTGIARIIGIGREVEGRRRDGSLFPMDLSITEISHVGRRMFVGLVRDITLRKQAESALREKNVELERFTNMISHDLKSPLVTIHTFLSYLQDDLAKADSVGAAKDIDYIETAAKKMTYMLEDLLEFSRIGQTRMEPVLTPWREIADEALALAAGAVTQKGVGVELMGTELSLLGERQRLVQVWQNLIDNAVKFMDGKASPCIQIGVEGQGRDSIFYVSDNGRGIEPRYHAKIFELFQRLDADTPGSGLGLALVKRIVEQYGGTITVESAGNGSGTCFRFTLPNAVCV